MTVGWAGVTQLERRLINGDMGYYSPAGPKPA